MEKKMLDGRLTVSYDPEQWEPEACWDHEIEVDLMDEVVRLHKTYEGDRKIWYEPESWGVMARILLPPNPELDDVLHAVEDEDGLGGALAALIEVETEWYDGRWRRATVDSDEWAELVETAREEAAKIPGRDMWSAGDYLQHLSPAEILDLACLSAGEEIGTEHVEAVQGDAESNGCILDADEVKAEIERAVRRVAEAEEEEEEEEEEEDDGCRHLFSECGPWTMPKS